MRRAILFVLLAVLPSNAWAAPAASVSALPTIPAPQPTTLPEVEPGTPEELEALLTRLASPETAVREEAATALASQDMAMLPAVAAKLAALRKSADRDAMTKILEGARSLARKSKKREKTKSAEKSKEPRSLAATEKSLIDEDQDDWLQFVFAKPVEGSQPYRDLVTILGLSRVCVCIGTTAAGREIINIYTYFGDLFRIDVQRQLDRMGEGSLPALIEAQYHDSRMVRSWAKRRLDLIGKAIPSEAVRTTDNQVLADVLRAYGRAREVEAVRSIVSFANSDRLQVREAAREAIGQIGDPARWKLREAYESLIGEKPNRAWDWKRTALELFAAYDRARLQEVYTTMDQGTKLYAEEKPSEAAAKFDQVLARAPLFPRRSEMVPAYLDHARSLREKDPTAALAVLRRARTIDPTGPHVDKVRSEIAVLEAEALAKGGIIDVTLLQQALDLDPSNARARTMLDEATRDVQTRQATWRRYAAAVAIGVIALAAMIFVALSPRRRRRQPEPAEPS